MTRARDDLAVSWALARNPGGRARRKPSRFLDPLLPEPAEPPGRAAGKPRKARPHVPRVRQAAPPPPRRPGPLRRLPGALRRGAVRAAARVAQGAGRAEEVPAFMVFSDATLEAIAEVKPARPRRAAAISGIGPDKLDKYGDELLALSADPSGRDRQKFSRNSHKSFAPYRAEP